ncbi:MAG TPA: SRPBCC family protein [Thermoanaerobaculia bacterium]|jgi:ribosome-associated toxin RatA of RatAB toxin-antitoxin module
MIRKQTTLDVPAALAREVFFDTDAWPLWMPGVTATRTLRSADGYRLIEVVQTHFGRRYVQDLECRLVRSTVSHRQHRGWFEKFEVDWTCRERPGGSCTLAVRLDFGMGMLGLVAPKRVVQVWMRGHLDQTIARASARARRLRGHPTP